jgi:hypothetical protein
MKKKNRKFTSGFKDCAIHPHAPGRAFCVSNFFNNIVDEAHRIISVLSPGQDIYFVFSITNDTYTLVYNGLFNGPIPFQAALESVADVAATENANLVTALYSVRYKKTGQDALLLQARKRGMGHAACVLIPYTWVDGKAVAGELLYNTMPNGAPNLIPAWWDGKHGDGAVMDATQATA